MFKELGNLASLLQSAGEMRRKMEALTADLKGKTVSGASGGGLVEVRANGLGEILGVRLDPSLVQRGDREMIEDLLPAAINQALEKSKELQAEVARNATEGLSIPGLENVLSKIIPK